MSTDNTILHFWWNHFIRLSITNIQCLFQMLHISVGIVSHLFSHFGQGGRSFAGERYLLIVRCWTEVRGQQQTSFPPVRRSPVMKTGWGAARGRGGGGRGGGRWEEGWDGPQPRDDVGRELRVGEHVRDQAVSLGDGRQIHRRLPAAPTPLVMLMLLLLMLLLVLLLVMMVMVTGLAKRKEQFIKIMHHVNNTERRLQIYCLSRC